MVEDDVIIGIASNANNWSAQRNGANDRYNLLDRGRAIIIGKSDERTVLIAYAKDVSSFQWFAEGLIARDGAAHVQQSIGCALLLWVRMFEYKIIAFTDDLGMKSRDDRLIDDNIVVRVAPDADYRFG